MARVNYADAVVDHTTGRPIAGATVAVSVYGGGIATLYSGDTGGGTVPSILTDQNGAFSVWLDPGRYQVTAGSQTRVVEAVSAVQTSSTGSFTVGGTLLASAHGLIVNYADAIDFTRDGNNPVRAQNYLTGSTNGTNGSRGDSIASATANSNGSFAISDFTSLVHATKGSMQGPSVIGTINEATEGAGIYGEMGLYEAALTINRQGAYAAIMEGAVTLNAGKQARGVGYVALMSEANTLASYTMLDAVWNDTGARGIWISNVGAQDVGSAIFVESGGHDFARGIYFKYSDLTKPMLYSKQTPGNTNPVFKLTAAGVLQWSDAGAAYGAGNNVNLYSAGSGFLKTDGGLSVVQQLLLRGNGTSYIDMTGNAFAQYVAASAGGHGAPPATVLGYFLIVDGNGVSGKVPYYAV